MLVSRLELQQNTPTYYCQESGIAKNPMQQTPNNNNPAAAGQSSQIDEQTLIALHQMGFFSQLLQNTSGASSSSHSQQQEFQNNESFLKEQLKSQMLSMESANQQQQHNKTSKEVSRRRPSLMHDSGSTSTGSRYSQCHLLSDTRNIPMGHSASIQLQDPFEEEDEKQKQLLSDRLSRIEREKSQMTNLQKNAQKRARACEALLRQEQPLMMADDGREDAEDSEGDLEEEQSPEEALIERIYAENRRKNPNNTGGAALAPPNHNNLTNAQLMAEDVARLEQEYQRGLQLLPALVQAMRIQRERVQDAVENRRIIYEEQLGTWERKVAAYEKSQKKAAKDVKHRELFEKTFIELRKMREEKERNLRVERSRFSLAQGGNGIPSTSEAINQMHFLDNDPVENEQDENDGNVDEKAYAAAIVPPTYVTRPRRFFDNRNGIVENAYAEASAQLEQFQNQWTDVEKAVFLEKIAIYGKNFAAIAAFLPSKNVKECIQYYYMTKKRYNYKQKFGRRRKKIGRQGYRPPIMPRFGDTEEQFQNYGRDCTFVECLLCQTRILVLESLSQHSRQQPFDSFGPVPPTSTQSHQQQIPICTKCQSQAQRNRSLNRCPLGSCSCLGGKRKMRPVRNLPEKFTTLSIEHKRFLIHRLKIPPSTNKCCTNCFKRLSKDMEGLLSGEYKSELDAFNNRAPLRAETHVKLALMLTGDEEEGMEAKGGFEEEEAWRGVEGPPLKELKLEVKEEEGEGAEEMMEETKAASLEQDTAVRIADLSRFQTGSLTKGIPNRNRKTILGSWEQQASAEHVQAINTEEIPSVSNIFNQKQQMDVGSFEDLAAKMLLTQFNTMNSCMGQQLVNELPTSYPGELKQQAKTGSGVVLVETTARKKLPENNGQEQRRGGDNLRRKSGLANALLPSPAVDGSSSVSRITPRKEEVAGGGGEEGTSPGRRAHLAQQQADSQGPLSSSCYESLSEDSDNENPDERQKKEEDATKKNSSGCGALNFFSLLDLMDDDERGSGTSTELCSAGPSSVTAQESEETRAKCIENKVTPTTSKGGGGTGTETDECLYEPLSEDEA